MDNEDHNPSLTVEEILATSIVFLLAGWLLWYYLANDGNTIQSNETTATSHSYPAIKPIQAPEISQSRKSIPNPTQSANQQNVSTSQVTKSPQAIVQTNQDIEENQLSLASIAPIIHPIKIVSTGSLQLNGTAAPNNQVLLFLNGYRVSSLIQVTATGLWSYETDIKPGKYSVQIIDDLNLTKSKKLEIVIPSQQAQFKKNPPLNDRMTKPPAKQTTNTATTENINANSQHRVKPGDTLYSLSKQYRVTITEIRRENHFSYNELLSVGQLLKIPRPSQP
jgi:LysM repeat protein